MNHIFEYLHIASLIGISKDVLITPSNIFLLGLFFIVLNNMELIKINIKNFYKNYINKQPTYEISMKIVYCHKTHDYYITANNRIKSILWYLYNKKDNWSSLNIISSIELPVNLLFNNESKNDSFTLPIQNKYIKIDQDILLKIYNEKPTITKYNTNYNNDNNENIKNTEVNEQNNITLIISSNKNIDYINKWTDKILKEYQEWQNQDILNNNYIYFSQLANNERANFRRYNYSSMKTFDNLFFHDKELLISRFTNYLLEKDKYKKLGIPHTLGILLHGLPGTGKTSCIKAISNYLNRSIVNINLNHMESIDILRGILLNKEWIGDEYRLPLNKRIYVFEEIDCNNNSDNNIFLNRVVKKENNNNLDSNLLNILIGTKDTKDYKELIKKDINKITTGKMLELLDGIAEIDDRIIIFTTNHIDKIDPAFLRPGRTDIIIEFKKLYKDDINNYYKLWFNKEIDPKKLKLIKDNIITQAEFGKLCFSNNEKKIIDILIKLSNNNTNNDTNNDSNNDIINYTDIKASVIKHNSEKLSIVFD